MEESESKQEDLQEEVHITPVYISSRAEDAPDIIIPKGAQYEIPLPPIDDRVKEDGDFLGYTLAVKFTYYNLGDSKTYPQYHQDRYLMVQRNPRIGRDDFIPMDHVRILERPGLLNLLKILHFGRGTEVNTMVWVLLYCVHGGYLWLSNPIELNVDLIHRITGLSKSGKDPQTHILGKAKDSKLSQEMVQKYKLQRGGQAYDLALSDDTL